LFYTAGCPITAELENHIIYLAILLKLIPIDDGTLMGSGFNTYTWRCKLTMEGSLMREANFTLMSLAGDGTASRVEGACHIG